MSGTSVGDGSRGLCFCSWSRAIPAGRHTGRPLREPSPLAFLSCPARSGIRCLWSFSLAHFPHEAGNRERAGVRGKRKAGEKKDTGSPLKITPPLRGSRRSQAARRRLRRWGAQGHPRRWPLHPHLHPLPSRERKRKEEQADTQGRPYKHPRPWLPPVMPDPIGHPVSLVFLPRSFPA